MVKDETKSDFALNEKKMCQFIFGIIWHGSKYWFKRHFEAVKHVLKGTVVVKYTLATMKKNVDIVKLDPVMRTASGKNLERQRKFFSTAKQ